MAPSPSLPTLRWSGPSRLSAGLVRTAAPPLFKVPKLSMLALEVAAVLGTAGLLMAPATPPGAHWQRASGLASTASNRINRTAEVRPPQFGRGGPILRGFEGAVGGGLVVEASQPRPPRPAGSKVPSSDRYAVISWQAAGVLLKLPVVDVGQRSRVRRLLRAVNRLLTVAPGTVFCDLTRGDVSITFHRSRGAPSNAIVREQLGCNSVVIRTATNTLGLSPGHLIQVLSDLSGFKVGQVN
jgi:hypothetical protein